MPKPNPTRMKQLPLFGVILQSTELVAPESPRKAFYRIWIEMEMGSYYVCKESGGLDKVLDRRRWEFETLPAAEKDLGRRVREKMRPGRKVRRYRLVGEG